jgi:hypothetical protein
MGSIVERCQRLLNWSASGSASYSTALLIPPERAVDSGAPPTLDVDAYFAVRLNQMSLSSGRKWWVDVDPMALMVSEFIYDGQHTAAPFVVGPSLIEKHGQPIPHGMRFDDTIVAGLHPYCGGKLSLTAVLYELPRASHARALLQLVETAGSVFTAATNLGAYLKVADVVLDGVEAVLGIDGVRPVAGRRHEIAPDLGDDLGSGYFALVSSEVASGDLWVSQKRLAQREASTGKLSDLTGADFLLYSMRSTRERTDLSPLPFQATATQALNLAAADASDEGWKRAKATLTASFLQIIDSPDLTTDQGDSLRTHLRERIKALHEEARQTANLGAAPQDAHRAAALADATSLLDL